MVELNLARCEKGFRSSRGRCGAPLVVCLSVLSGLWACDRGHRRRSFRLLDLSKKFRFHLAYIQNSFKRKIAYPFAANFLVLTAYASRQAGEQKWRRSPPSLNGMESVSSTCMPARRIAHQPARCSRSWNPGRGICGFAAQAPSHSGACRRRCGEEPHAPETTRSQNRNLRMRARKFILMIVWLNWLCLQSPI